MLLMMGRIHLTCSNVQVALVERCATVFAFAAYVRTKFADIVLREATKISKYARAYNEMDNIHFEPFVLESGGVFWGKSTSCL